MEKCPIITTRDFSILEAKEEDNTWVVTAKMGGKTRKINIQGTAEDVLKKVSSSDRVCPFQLRVFLSNLEN